MLNNNLYSNMYNPDVLSTLANLSSDEVFTPPEIVNQMLDLLPADLWSNPEATFLDPACKSGVFLREIAKRLINGLEDEMPDLQERLDHIFHNQLYGIAITELTSLLSRRSLYGSKYANSIFSFSEFDNPIGNIKFNIIEHTWDRNRCKYCGASKSEYDRKGDLETHAYEFIHRKKVEEIFNMKFDVIIGNPPYQLETDGAGRQAKPIYHHFIKQAKKLNPRYLVMITPSRWFSGGMGLKQFRKEMLSDRRIKEIVDFSLSSDCFPGVNIAGGVNYFLWDRSYDGDCLYTYIDDGNKKQSLRRLDEFNIFIRDNRAIKIIHKVMKKTDGTMNSMMSSLGPFGLGTAERGIKNKKVDTYTLLSSAGKSYIDKEKIKTGHEYIDKWKVIIAKAASGGAATIGGDGKRKVIATLEILEPGAVCTFTYFIGGAFKSKEIAENCRKYLSTKFARFLLLQTMSSINITKDRFIFVPIQDFKKTWTDNDLYKKYDLDEEEIEIIESMISAME